MENNIMRLRVSEVVDLGKDYAKKEDWKTIDDLIVPVFEEKLKSFQTLVENNRGDYNKIRETSADVYARVLTLLKDSNAGVRDYGAILSAPLIKYEKYITDYRAELLDVLKDIAYKDEAVWPKYRASLALIECDLRKQDSPSLGLDFCKLRDNITAAIVLNKDLSAPSMPYSEYIKRKL